MEKRLIQPGVKCPKFREMVDTGAACAFDCTFFDGFDSGSHKLYCAWEGSAAADRRSNMEKWEKGAATDAMNRVILYLTDKYIVDSRTRVIGWGGHIYIKQADSDASIAIKIGYTGSDLRGTGKKARLCIDGLWFYLEWDGEAGKWNIDFTKLDAKLERRLREANDRSKRVDNWIAEVNELNKRLSEMFVGVDVKVEVLRLKEVNHITLYAPWGSISCESDTPFQIRSIRFERNVDVQMDLAQVKEFISTIGKYCTYPESKDID